MMTLKEVENVMHVVFKELNSLREAGQKEYAGGENAFGNFERLAAALQMDKKKVLWVYVAKHLDGIQSFLNGHISQREDVRGRINDVIVYLILLRAMLEDEDRNNKAVVVQNSAMQNIFRAREEMPVIDYEKRDKR